MNEELTRLLDAGFTVEFFKDTDLIMVCQIDKDNVIWDGEGKTVEEAFQEASAKAVDKSNGRKPIWCTKDVGGHARTNF